MKIRLFFLYDEDEDEQYAYPMWKPHWAGADSVGVCGVGFSMQARLRWRLLSKGEAQ